MNRALLVAGEMVLITVVLGGCGSKPAANPASSSGAAATVGASFDPCSVLTTDEVAAITTDKVDHTKANGPDCQYQTSIDSGAELSIYPTGGEEEMQDIKAANKVLGDIGDAVSGQGDVGKDVQSSITPPAASSAPPIGDEAVWQPNDVLAVRKGDAFVEVTPPMVHDPASHKGASFISTAEKREISQKLAEAALAKLGY